MIKKKLLLKSTIEQIKYPKNFEKHHSYLFPIKKKFKSSKVNYFIIKKLKLDQKGNILNIHHNKIIQDFLAYKSLNNFVFLKKLILFVIFFFKKKNIYYHKKKEKNVIVFHNRHSYGFFHWTTDILPKISLLINDKKFKKLKFFLPKYKSKFQKESLKKVNSNRIVTIGENEILEVSNAIYVPQLYLSGNPRKKLLIQTKKFYLNRYNHKKFFHDKIYVSRRFSRRSLVKEYEFENILKKFKFKILFNEKLSFEKQVNIFSNTRLVVGLTGAGLANMIWMKKNSTLINIRPDDDPNIPFLIFANHLKINYYYYLAKKTSRFLSSTHSNFKINFNDFVQRFNNILKS